jgi:hypothetical protein
VPLGSVWGQALAVEVAEPLQVAALARVVFIDGSLGDLVSDGPDGPLIVEEPFELERPL